MQLIEGRTAQEYNFRKKRKGAFWEDRYHATAIGSDDHLFNCITYINLNMVRAGVVDDPIKWKDSGYFEIQNIGKSNDIIDSGSLLSLLHLKSIDQLKAAQQKWVTDALKRNDLKRDSKWTESIAVGNEAFIEDIKQKLGQKALYRTMENKNEAYVLSDGEIPYKISLGS
jgi:putative transposase